MDTSVDRVIAGLAGAKTRHGLTEAKLRELQPGERAYKVSDGGNGLYVVVSPSGSRSFRYDYRLGGRRETLTIGRHEPVPRHAHVHISVRAESRHGKRLNPRKADLHLWRETFAEKLRDQGIEAEATRQATRGRDRNYDALWRLKAREDGRLRTTRRGTKSTAAAKVTRAQAIEAWMHVGKALAMSGDADDRRLAGAIAAFIKEMPISQAAAPERAAPQQVPRTRVC